MKYKEIQEVRERLLLENDGVCPILKIILDPKDSCLDHAHQGSEFSKTVDGQVRDTIHKYANSLEGVMRSRFLRSGVANFITFEEFLLNLHLYLMNNRQNLLHPQHSPKPKKLTKRSYNKLIKEIKIVNNYRIKQKQKQIKIPMYPKSQKLTKKLKELYFEFKINPEYYLKGPK